MVYVNMMGWIHDGCLADFLACASMVFVGSMDTTLYDVSGEIINVVPFVI